MAEGMAKGCWERCDVDSFTIDINNDFNSLTKDKRLYIMLLC